MQIIPLLLLLALSFEQIVPKLESILWDILQWITKYNLKANAGKFRLFLSLYEDQTITVSKYITLNKRRILMKS